MMCIKTIPFVECGILHFTTALEPVGGAASFVYVFCRATCVRLYNDLSGSERGSNDSV
jgi:hypothetical protein